MSSKLKHISTHLKRGFTLIELLVVTGIIIIVSAAILADSGRLGGQFILDNFAYDMALTLREAQQYGISVQNFGGNFNVAYGVHFDSSNNVNYVLFADALTPNGLYDTGEIVQSYTITRGFRITAICATPYGNSSVENCGLTSLDILFKRPEPDALISMNGNSCVLAASNCQASARVVLTAPRGNTKSVIIPASGQMSVQ
ncbi:prepilin-type N-terminal cleavage/methylation domain-containing protein [Candidatus Kaiserbacteria bacterium]|nr:prepilin-type N-terminal cleavage/methylation domain-containing protein [Candidatus Kaiserbacteria bacterium]